MWKVTGGGKVSVTFGHKYNRVMGVSETEGGVGNRDPEIEDREGEGRVEN